MNGRYHAGYRRLDELEVGSTDDGKRYTKFNGCEMNGSWQLRENCLALYFGRDEISGPADLKWLVFQHVPGSHLWIAVKDPDERHYTCVISHTIGDFARVTTPMLDFTAEIRSVHVRETRPPSTHSSPMNASPSCQYTATEDEPADQALEEALAPIYRQISDYGDSGDSDPDGPVTYTRELIGMGIDTAPEG